eukprot:CAMPEP_0176170610 /NCGR_PEP_ID=MMETSP0120_2-20121206/87343_1 /TAXON_ID=160619 /ORGANISM="Kryptoperidinium foliaceum, Strain CCMP 1326" /LENGTH=299 /DNA_ID=CAMNT_0017508419 /DNA_START=14 /DNA_END=914 /DNA_ORIENTATION=-
MTFVDDDDDEADDDDDDVLQSPGARTTKIELRPGDVIEYFPPELVFGRKNSSKQSMIVGVNKKKSNPLNLESGDFLPKDSRVRRIAKMWRGKVVPDTKSVWRVIEDYSLPTAGTDKLVGLEKQVRSIQGIRSSFAASVDKFWEDRADAAEAEDGNTSESPKKKQRVCKKASKEQEKTTYEESSSSKDEKPKGHPMGTAPSKKIAEEEENLKKRRRYVPHMSPQDLRLVMEVWDTLQKKKEDPQVSLRIGGAVEMLSGDMDLTELQLDAILRGDPQVKLSLPKKLKVLEALKNWVSEQQK